VKKIASDWRSEEKEQLHTLDEAHAASLAMRLLTVGVLSHRTEFSHSLSLKPTLLSSLVLRLLSPLWRFGTGLIIPRKPPGG